MSLHLPFQTLPIRILDDGPQPLNSEKINKNKPHWQYATSRSNPPITSHKLLIWQSVLPPKDHNIYNAILIQCRPCSKK